LMQMGEHSFATFKSSYASISEGGGTPTNLALSRTRTQQLYNLPGVDPEPSRSKAVVLITDGSPNDCVGTAADRIEHTVVEAQKPGALGVPVYVLGFTGVNADIMAAIAYAGDAATAANVPSQRCSEKYAGFYRNGNRYACPNQNSNTGCSVLTAAQQANPGC